MISLTTIKFFSEFEYYYYLEENIVEVSEINKLYSLSRAESINEIKKIAIDEGVNIYQLNYDTDSRGIESQIYYYAIGDIEKYNAKFSTLHGVTKSFNPSVKIESYPIEDTLGNQTTIRAKVESDDKLKLASAVRRLTNLEINCDVKTSTTFFTAIFRALYSSKILFHILLIAILLIPVNTYFYLSKAQEIYVKKLFGHDMIDIKISLVLSNLKIQTVSFIIVCFIQILYLYFYNGLAKFSVYIIVYIIITLLFMILLTIGCYSFVHCFVIFQKINNSISGKRANILIFLINFVFKLSFFSILIFLTNVYISDYKEIQTEKNISYKWEILRDYVDFNYKYITELPTNNRLLNEYMASNNSKQLFKSAESNGGILVDTSRFSEASNYESNLELGRKMIFVNNNYLKLEPAFDENNNLINTDLLDSSTIYLLVPAKLKAFTPIVLEEWSEFFNTMPHFMEAAYLKSLNQSPKKYEKVAMEVIYMKNDQKFFLYNPLKSKASSNFALDPIFAVVDAQQLGSALCLSSMTSGSFKAYVGSEEFSLDVLKEEINNNNASDMIKAVNSYNNSIARYLYRLNVKQNETIFLVIVSYVVELCILFISILIFIEANMQSIYIKILHGYSKILLYYKILIYLIFGFFLALALQYTVIDFYVLHVVSFFFIIEVLCSLVIFLNITGKSVIIRLKGRI